MDPNQDRRRGHFHRGRRGPDRRGFDRRAPAQPQPPQGRDQIDVEQIMREIRARIALRHGVELSHQQIDDLAARRLEYILDPRAMKPEFLDTLRRSADEAVQRQEKRLPAEQHPETHLVAVGERQLDRPAKAEQLDLRDDHRPLGEVARRAAHRTELQHLRLGVHGDVRVPLQRVDAEAGPRLPPAGERLHVSGSEPEEEDRQGDRVDAPESTGNGLLPHPLGGHPLEGREPKGDRDRAQDDRRDEHERLRPGAESFDDVADSEGAPQVRPDPGGQPRRLARSVAPVRLRRQYARSDPASRTAVFGKYVAFDRQALPVAHRLAPAKATGIKADVGCWMSDVRCWMFPAIVGRNC